MDYHIDGAFVVYADGTRQRVISGAQEDFSSIITQYDAGQLVQDMHVDAYLTVGGTPVDYGGVPFGSAEAAGYTSLSDILRDGGTSEAYVSTVNSGSLSDILRSGGTSPGFDPAVYNANPPGVVTEWNITSVIDSVTKGIATLGGLTLGAIGLSRSSRSGSAGTGQRSPTGSGQPTLAQRMFGMRPGASGNMPQMLGFAAFGAVGVFLLFMLARR